jgi:hypothetical protein
MRYLIEMEKSEVRIKRYEKAMKVFIVLIVFSALVQLVALVIGVML